MWKVIVAVLALAFLTLMILLRSILLPLKAIVMNLLSVGAAYGVLVVVFQWGWFDSIFHYESRGYLETLTPSLILAIVFGLSMDYEVFLLTRIKERWLASGDAAERSLRAWRQARKQSAAQHSSWCASLQCSSRPECRQLRNLGWARP